VTVDGVGPVDIETEYLPGVIACENGGAPPAALRAQAVMARTYLYYRLFVRGATSIGNSQGSQVFTCDHRPDGPGPEHLEAAAATKGQYLTFEDEIIAAFYVAGAIPPAPDPDDPWTSCRGDGGDDPTGTEELVTYNRGKSGCDIEMSSQGSITQDCRDNPYNRGTASQNGQACLADVGVTYEEMFAMYYGEDIQLVVAQGECGGAALPEEQFCSGRSDGGFCFDKNTRIECAAGAASLTEVCDFGCSQGACVREPEAGFCAERDDGAHCDGATRIVCEGGMAAQSEACIEGCVDGACAAGGHLEIPGAPPLVGPSPGIEGGCSTVGSAGEPGWLLAGLLLVGRRRR
jgi:hypothetical protein